MAGLSALKVVRDVPREIILRELPVVRDHEAWVHPETLYAETSDRWRIAVHHWASRGAVRRGPVLVVHGLATNRVNLHPDPSHSIVLQMAQAGFDVFVPELRGAGLSRAPNGERAEEYHWGFGEYTGLDMPAVIRLVLERTGASSLHAVGHSMGGMLLYAHGTRRSDEIRSLVTLGTPSLRNAELRRRERRLLRLALKVMPESAALRVPILGLIGVAGSLPSLGAWFVDGTVVNSDNIETGVMLKMAQEAIDDVPFKLICDVAKRVFADDDYEGPFEFEEQLYRVDCPALVMSGAVDGIAPPAAVERAALKLGGSQVRYREMGTRFGDCIDYGHIDLLVGKHAPQEVFPRIIEFLMEHD